MKYEGEWSVSNSSRIGTGTIYQGNGDKFEGQWDSILGFTKGTGTWIEEGVRFVGTFNGDMGTGNGKIHTGSNSVFEGEWDYGKCVKTGKGSMTIKDLTFEGEWNGCQGTGVIFSKNGEKLENATWGCFINTNTKYGCLGGNGVIIHNNNRYEGTWELFVGGEGTITYPDGTKYVGKWNNDGEKLLE